MKVVHLALRRLGELDLGPLLPANTLDPPSEVGVDYPLVFPVLISSRR